MASKKKFLEKLKKINEKAQISTSQKYLLLNLLDYVEQYESSEAISIIESIREEEKAFNKEYTLSEEKLLKRYNMIYEDLKTYKTTHKIPSDNLNLMLEDIWHKDPKKRKRIDSSWDPISEKKAWLERELQLMLRQQKKLAELNSTKC